MNYSLAKELKDAGFVSNGQAWNDTLKEILPVPTLSELIEACEGNRQITLRGVPKLWEAFTNDHFLAGGSTPTEAVARLWLSLNKKI